jgi:ribosomal protein L4
MACRSSRQGTEGECVAGPGGAAHQRGGRPTAAPPAPYTRGGAIAFSPVISRPTISDWMLSVPSKVKTASMSA